MSFPDHPLSSSLSSPKSRNNQNHFYFQEEILAASTVSTSLGLFATTQTDFCNSSGTASSRSSAAYTPAHARSAALPLLRVQVATPAARAVSP